MNRDAAIAYDKAFGGGKANPLMEDPALEVARISDVLRKHEDHLYICGRKNECTCVQKNECICDDDNYEAILSASIEVMSNCKTLLCITLYNEPKLLRTKKTWRIFSLTEEDEEIPILDLKQGELSVINGPTYSMTNRRKRDRSITVSFNYLIQQ